MNAHQRKVARDDRSREQAELAELRARATDKVAELGLVLNDLRAAHASTLGEVASLRNHARALSADLNKALLEVDSLTADRLERHRREGVLRADLAITRAKLDAALAEVESLKSEDKEAAPLRRRLQRKTAELDAAHAEIRRLQIVQRRGSLDMAYRAERRLVTPQNGALCGCGVHAATHVHVDGKVVTLDGVIEEPR